MTMEISAMGMDVEILVILNLVGFAQEELPVNVSIPSHKPIDVS